MTTIYFRQAQPQDIPAMMHIIDEAKVLLAKDNSPQWQNGYPNEQVLAQDIKQGFGYVLIVDKQIVATAALQQTPDENYQHIEEGSWLKEEQPFTTIHRIALSSNYRGMSLATFFLSHLISESYRLGFRQVRADTHRINQRMKHLLEKTGFQYRGIIYVKDYVDNARDAYQLCL